MLAGSPKTVLAGEDLYSHGTCVCACLLCVHVCACACMRTCVPHLCVIVCRITSYKDNYFCAYLVATNKLRSLTTSLFSEQSSFRSYVFPTHSRISCHWQLLVSVIVTDIRVDQQQCQTITCNIEHSGS